MSVASTISMTSDRNSLKPNKQSKQTWRLCCHDGAGACNLYSSGLRFEMMSHSSSCSMRKAALKWWLSNTFLSLYNIANSDLHTTPCKHDVTLRYDDVTLTWC